MGEQALFEAADEHTIKLQAFAGVHGHQLHGVLPGLGLVVAGFERGMRQEGRQGREGFASVDVHFGPLDRQGIDVSTRRCG